MVYRNISCFSNSCVNFCSSFLLQVVIHNPLNRQHSELRSKNVSLSNGDPFTIALFGVNSNAQRKSENDGERSDTIMLLSINPKKQTTEIVVYLVIHKLKL